ncbi:unnamed protein product [Alternaria burnsii]|nr:unnamed protein product [Alternaria burnsii]
MDVLTTESSAPAIAKHISGRCITPASNLERAKDWLNDCIRNHNHDQVRTATRPSRLVAVGTADGSASIKIVDGSDPDKGYLAVSYRWGGETLLTTSETFELFHISIPWKQLPQTFQDAIHIARGLGIRYMWIDSLCIIQDNLADWETESAKMADIYKGAFLTIMAASASDSQGGFFRDRATVKEIAALPYTNANGASEFSVFVHETLPSFHSSTFASRLFQRGWVFQERLMSKRKLIFGEDQKYWECNGIVQSESNIQSPNDWYLRLYANFRVFCDPLHKTDGIDGQVSPAILWRNVVGQFSACVLTYEADRLPALSGIARTFSQRFDSSYAAGLWQDQMPKGLEWCVHFQASKETHQGVYCAPSWSWASTIGAVTFVDGINFELEIISINIKLAGQDPYGRVCPGSSMCARGRLCSGTVVRGKPHDPAVCLETEHGRFRSSLFLDRDDQDLPLEVVCLEVSSGELGKRNAGCLLLCKTGEDKYFRRVGIAFLKHVPRDEDYLFHGIEKQVVILV